MLKIMAIALTTVLGFLTGGKFTDLQAEANFNSHTCNTSKLTCVFLRSWRSVNTKNLADPESKTFFLFCILEITLLLLLMGSG